MDRAQAEFEAAGLDVPHYAAFGNHDALVQGNAFANAAYERVATGCVKPMAPLTADTDTLSEAFEGIAALNLPAVLSLVTTDPTKIALVPPDEDRQFVSKPQWKQIWKDGTQADGHGFDYVDPVEEDGVGRFGRLLLVEPRARDPVHLRRHDLRGGGHRPVGRRQRRPPAVPLASGRAGGRRGGRRAGDPVLAPRDPEPDRGRRGRAGADRASAPTRTATTPTPAATPTRATPSRSTSAPT